MLHSCLGCRTLNHHTPLTAMTSLCGLTVEEVEARGFKVCGFGKRASNERRIKLVTKFITEVCDIMDAVVAELGDGEKAS